MKNTINPKYGVPVPLYLKCKVTGKEVMYTAPDYIKKVIDKAGGLEQLEANYVSREGRSGAPKQAKSAKAPKEPKPIKTGKSWGGQSLDTNTQTVKDSGDSKEDPVEYAHKEFRLDDWKDSEGSHEMYCTVDAPKNCKEEIPIMQFDYRSKKLGNKA